MVPSLPSALLVAGSIPSGGKTFTKNCVNYQLDNLLIKGVVGSTIKTWQPKNVGDDGQESSTIKRVTHGPLESYTGGQKPSCSESRRGALEVLHFYLKQEGVTGFTGRGVHP